MLSKRGVWLQGGGFGNTHGLEYQVKAFELQFTGNCSGKKMLVKGLAVKVSDQ